MEEERPYIPYTPPTPPKKEHKGLKMLGLAVLLLLLAGSASFAALVWMKNNELQSSLTNEQNATRKALADNNKLKSQLDAKPDTADITDTLPDGRTITYADTASNRNILWWSAGKNTNNIVLSHKLYQQYLAAVDTKVIETVCGTDAKPKAAKYNISAGVLDTTSKELMQPATQDCVDLLASEENTDETSRTEAQKVIQTVDTDVAAFVESITVQEANPSN